MADLISSRENEKLSVTGKNDTASPVVGWMFLLMTEEDGKNVELVTRTCEKHTSESSVG
jgi:hypothetical protein